MTKITQLYALSIYQATPTIPLSTQTIEQITHRGRVLAISPGSRDGPQTILSGLHMPDGIAISNPFGLIFWTNMGTPGKNDGSLESAFLDGSDRKPLLPPGAVHTPKQLILDEEAGKLYFCDREGLRIHSCNMDGSDHQILVQTGDWQNPEHQADQTRWCVGIAVSEKHRRLFWTQKGAPKSTQGRMFSANLQIPAGETAETRTDIEVVASNLPEPIDLEFDEDSDSLYWTDRGEFPFGNTLNRKKINFNGSSEVPEAEKVLGREILAEGFAEAIGLALDKENDCAWVADLGGRIWKCDRHKPARKVKVYEEETAVFTGLAVL
jgi:hypothetical protein